MISRGSRRAGSQAEPGLSAVSAPWETLSNLPWLCLYHVPTRYVHLPGITHSGSVAGLKIPRSCTKAQDSCQYGHLKPVCPQRRWASGRQHHPAAAPVSLTQRAPPGMNPRGWTRGNPIPSTPLGHIPTSQHNSTTHLTQHLPKEPGLCTPIFQRETSLGWGHPTSPLRRSCWH